MSPETPAAGTASGARSLPHPSREEIRLAQVLHALADPMRLRIVCVLAAADDELKVYRGTAKMNGLRRDDLDALFPGLIDGVLRAAGLQDRRLSEAH